MNVLNSTKIGNKTMGPPPPSGDIGNHLIYISFGIAAVITNLAVIIILAKKKKLFASSAFTIGLALADLINGVAMIAGGSYRISTVFGGINKNIVRPWDCLLKFSTVTIVGIQLPSMMLFLIGIERILAVAFFSWYYLKWSNKIAWSLTSMIFGLCMCSVGASWIIAGTSPNNITLPISCTPPPVMQLPYSTYNYSLAAASGVVSITATFTALLLFLYKRKKLTNRRQADGGTGDDARFQKHLKKQWYTTVTMTCIALLDFAVVVIPNCMFLLLVYKVPFMPPSLNADLGPRLELLFGARSFSSLLVYVVFNQEFRRALLEFLKFKQNRVGLSHVNSTSKNQLELKKTDGTNC